MFSRSSILRTHESERSVILSSYKLSPWSRYILLRVTFFLSFSSMPRENLARVSSCDTLHAPTWNTNRLIEGTNTDCTRYLKFILMICSTEQQTDATNCEKQTLCLHKGTHACSFHISQGRLKFPFQQEHHQEHAPRIAEFDEFFQY